MKPDQRPEAPYVTGLPPTPEQLHGLTTLEKAYQGQIDILQQQLAQAQQQTDLAWQQRDLYLTRLQNQRPVIEAARLLAQHPRSTEALTILHRKLHALDATEPDPQERL